MISSCIDFYMRWQFGLIHPGCDSGTDNSWAVSVSHIILNDQNRTDSSLFDPPPDLNLHNRYLLVSPALCFTLRFLRYTKYFLFLRCILQSFTISTEPATGSCCTNARQLKTVYLFYDFSVADIFSWNTFVQYTHEFIIKSSGKFSQRIN